MSDHPVSTAAGVLGLTLATIRHAAESTWRIGAKVAKFGTDTTKVTRAARPAVRRNGELRAKPHRFAGNYAPGSYVDVEEQAAEERRKRWHRFKVHATCYPLVFGFALLLGAGLHTQGVI
jgi:hypothetical protein